MKNPLLIFLFLILFIPEQNAQGVEFYGGWNSNTFRGIDQSGYGTGTFDYRTGNGFSFGVAIDSIRSQSLSWRFTAKYESYQGGLDVCPTTKWGCTYGVQAHVKKSVITLGVFPINLPVLKVLELNIGAEYSILIDEAFTGNISVNPPLQSPYESKLEDKYPNYSAAYTIGLSSRIAYNIPISANYMLTPQYLFHLGLSREFYEYPEFTKSYRHFLGIGFRRKL